MVGLARPVTKWCTLVKDVRDLPRALNEAFAIALSGRPGPVLVDLPKDVTASILKDPVDEKPRVARRLLERESQRSAAGVAPEQLARVADMINKAKNPIIYAGQGVLSARGEEELRALAIKAKIPVTTTLLGMGAFDETHPQSLHMLGMHGSAYANYAMQNADVILALGARFDDRITGNVKKFAPAAYAAAAEGKGGIIHFDITEKNVNKVIRVHEAVLGDVKENMAALTPLLRGQPREAWWRYLEDLKKKHPFTYPPSRENGALKPQRVIEEVYKQQAAAGRVKDTIITTGVGQQCVFSLPL